MLKKIWKGFSWIEIATALLLFLFVVMLTLPSFSRFKCLAKQSEAKFEVMRIFAAVELFKREHARNPTLKELVDSGRVKLRQQHYIYEITTSDRGGDVYILAIGKADSQVHKDRWRVGPDKKLENLQDACEQ